MRGRGRTLSNRRVRHGVDLCHARTPSCADARALYDGPSLLVSSRGVRPSLCHARTFSVSCADDWRVMRGRSACRARTIGVSCADVQRVMRGRPKRYLHTEQHDGPPPLTPPDSPRIPPEKRGRGREESIRIITNSLWNGLYRRRDLLHFHRAATHHARLAPVSGAARRAPDDRQHGDARASSLARHDPEGR